MTVLVTEGVMLSEDRRSREEPVEDVAARATPGDVGCVLIIDYRWPSYRDRKGDG